jgi:hypothetical protein
MLVLFVGNNMAIRKAVQPIVIILIVVALSLIASTVAVITVNQSVTSSGTITTSPNIGVYSDSGCTNNMTTVNWGNIAAGGTSSQTVYVKNTGTGTMNLNLATSNWSPAGANTYITITWNQQGTQLTAGQSTSATITLSVSSSITGITNFSNTITISGTG